MPISRMGVSDPNSVFNRTPERQAELARLHPSTGRSRFSKLTGGITGAIKDLGGALEDPKLRMAIALVAGGMAIGPAAAQTGVSEAAITSSPLFAEGGTAAAGLGGGTGLATQPLFAAGGTAAASGLAPGAAAAGGAGLATVPLFAPGGTAAAAGMAPGAAAAAGGGIVEFLNSDAGKLATKLGLGAAGVGLGLSNISDPSGPISLGHEFGEARQADIAGLRGLETEFAGNEGALINARMNPLRAQVAQAGGALERGLGRRGIAGSSFATQDRTNFATDTGRALGDAQATATMDALLARLGIKKDISGLNQQAVGQRFGEFGLGFQADIGSARRDALRGGVIGRGIDYFGSTLSG